MQIFDRGRGVPLVLIPGIQGRWEYLRPAVEALASHFRVVTFPLPDGRVSKTFEPSRELDRLADHVLSVIGTLQLQRPVLCGISFGGLVALRVAARHAEQTGALVLASTPGPAFRLSKRHRTYLRAPWLLGPLFVAETPARLRSEIHVAMPRAAERLRLGLRQFRTLVTAPLSLSAMAARARMIGAADLLDDCARVAAPTLVITGEPSLDRIVHTDSTLEFARLIAGARTCRIDRTGHVGYLTRPHAFASAIDNFVSSLEAGRHDAA
jgi:pimeloyl-ACP methyl ester carboxylesterase